MHESAIAQSIVQTVLREAEKQDANKVETIDIEIGDLTFLGIEQVEFWVKTSFQGTIAEDAKINFKRIKGRLKCGACGYEGDIKIVEDPAYHLHVPSFSCPSCHSTHIDITRGKETYIRQIKILKKDG